MNSNKSLAASQTDFNFDYDPEDNYCDFDRVVTVIAETVCII